MKHFSQTSLQIISTLINWQDDTSQISKQKCYYYLLMDSVYDDDNFIIKDKCMHDALKMNDVLVY